MRKISKLNLRIDEAELISYDGKKLPFDDDYFDIIFSNAVLEHIKDLDPFIKEIFHGDLKVQQYFFDEMLQRLSNVGEYEINHKNKNNVPDSFAEVKIMELLLDTHIKEELHNLITGKEDIFLEILIKMHNKISWQFYTVNHKNWVYSTDFWYEIPQLYLGKKLSVAIKKKIINYYI